jgi:ankyrin repeat protein
MMVDAGLDMKNEGVGLALVSACGSAGDDVEGQDAVALALIRAGADVNFRTRSGETPLSTAVSFERRTMIDSLKRAGASE